MPHPMAGQYGQELGIVNLNKPNFDPGSHNCYFSKVNSVTWEKNGFPVKTSVI